MSAEEASALAANPNLDAILQVRRWYDQPKIPGHSTPPFSRYAPILQRVVDRYAEAAVS